MAGFTASMSDDGRGKRQLPLPQPARAAPYARLTKLAARSIATLIW